MASSHPDFASLEHQFERFRKELEARHTRLEEERLRAKALNEKLKELPGYADLNILRQIGLDLDTLKAQQGKALEIVHQDLEQFKRSSPPQGLAQQREQENLLHRATGMHASMLPPSPQFSTPWWWLWWWLFGAGTGDLYPPAYRCNPTGPFEGYGCNPNIGELKLYRRSTGLGGSWGLGATPAISPLEGFLTFVFIPPINCKLYVTPFVDVQGTVYLWADDTWYTSTEGKIQLSLHSGINTPYFSYPGPPVMVVNEDHDNASLSYWISQRYAPTSSTDVSAGDLVFIWVAASLEVLGRSDRALVEADFSSGADKYIRVPRIAYRLDPI